MADLNKIEAQLRKLINDANVVTGKTDNNITDGINSLIDGYGQSNDNNKPLLQDKTFDKNGTYVPDDGYDGFGEITIVVPSEELPTAEGVEF